MTVLLIIGAVYAACGIVLAVMLWTARDGYEDERGFHYGRDPRLGEPAEETGEGSNYKLEFTVVALLVAAGMARWFLG